MDTQCSMMTSKLWQWRLPVAFLEAYGTFPAWPTVHVTYKWNHPVSLSISSFIAPQSLREVGLTVHFFASTGSRHLFYFELKYSHIQRDSSFRCTAWWLGVYIHYRMLTLISVLTTCHRTNTILFPIVFILHFSSLWFMYFVTEVYTS